ncbi:hypothetical protein EV651_107226 [Kribbella sp. VKM Ac-2571]|uniref:hypothetical protein n=1 Tax=Kribbella sp. VKM Ac-2571 TaxID=2512222 RepID=UPI0010DC8119|nr:hypothetical protein [Kribbella sp. VKM Ac-2571]TDO60952.1 hypothetical protein EV651_107226 [Kribbella sp. VKM Ac-2571]
MRGTDTPDDPHDPDATHHADNSHERNGSQERNDAGERDDTGERGDTGDRDDTQTSAAADIAAVERTVRQLAPAGERVASTSPDGAGAEHLLAALTKLHAVQTQLAAWEPLLIGAARAEGASWAAIAPVLGVASRQAAERRFLRLNPHSADRAGMTGEERVQAARDRRAGQRAVSRWADANAAELRRLAAQIAALEDLDPATQDSVDQVFDALGDADTAALLGLLVKAEPHLQESHPHLAGEIAEIGRTTDRLRRRPNSRTG